LPWRPSLKVPADLVVFATEKNTKKMYIMYIKV
jgi:hypothetical protein